MTKFTKRTVIVTGGASGIGQAAAKRIFAEGANVVVVDVNKDGARRIAESLGDAGRACSTALDVTDRSRVHRMMAEAAARFGHLHALVNCAGIRGVTSVLDAEAEQWAASTPSTSRGRSFFPRNLPVWRSRPATRPRSSILPCWPA